MRYIPCTVFIVLALGLALTLDRLVPSPRDVSVSIPDDNRRDGAPQPWHRYGRCYGADRFILKCIERK